MAHSAVKRLLLGCSIALIALIAIETNGQIIFPDEEEPTTKEPPAARQTTAARDNPSNISNLTNSGNLTTANNNLSSNNLAASDDTGDSCPAGRFCVELLDCHLKTTAFLDNADDDNDQEDKGSTANCTLPDQDEGGEEAGRGVCCLAKNVRSQTSKESK